MTKVTFYLGTGDYNRVKSLTQFEEFVFHHPQLVWVWSTYFRLKQKGHDVLLSSTMPDNGIVVLSAINFDMFQKPPQNVFIIVTLADSPPPFYSHVNVSQNPMQAQNYPNFLGYPVWRHIAHWPQPNILERDPSRGDKFENIVFFGHRDQLAAPLATDDFKNQVKQIGLNFEIRTNNFNDYREVDGIVAIRSFSSNKYLNKPFSKLVNAWFGKTPVIVGKESAFEAIRKSNFDFIMVSDRERLFHSLFKLKQDTTLRKQMIENGTARAKEFTEDNILAAWEKLLFEDANEYYRRWKRMNNFTKQLFYVDLFVSRSFRSVKNNIKRPFQKI